MSAIPHANELPDENPRCDFCCAGEPAWHFYPAHDFDAEDFIIGTRRVTAHSLNMWAACKKCCSLIDRDMWNVLADRSVDSYIKTYKPPKEEIPWLRPALREQIMRWHQKFRDHRRMEA